MTKFLTIVALALIIGGLTFQFAALETFNLLVPKDKGALRLAKDVAYGPDSRHRLDVYAPTEGQGPWPMVVFVHGGSWQEGNKNPYGFVGHALAAQGFLALVINYRLHPNAPYPAFVDDTALALQWAAGNGATFGGDATKLFAMGHSAGAYNIAMATLDQVYASKRPALRGVITLAGPFDFVPLDSPITKKVFGAVAGLAATQPINHAQRDAPPFLILHGTKDKTVFPRNATALDSALKKAGANSHLRFYDGVSHVGILLALSRWQRSAAPVLAEAVAFMKDRSK
jgi:acetyl esterase/lipase